MGAISIGTTVTPLFSANKERSVFTVQNTHATQNLYVYDSPATILADGLLLAPGDAIEFSKMKGWDTTKTWYAIASGAATTGRLAEGFAPVNVIIEKQPLYNIGLPRVM